MSSPLSLSQLVDSLAHTVLLAEPALSAAPAVSDGESSLAVAEALDALAKAAEANEARVDAEIEAQAKAFRANEARVDADIVAQAKTLRGRGKIRTVCMTKFAHSSVPHGMIACGEG